MPSHTVDVSGEKCHRASINNLICNHELYIYQHFIEAFSNHSDALENFKYLFIHMGGVPSFQVNDLYSQPGCHSYWLLGLSQPASLNCKPT